MTDDAQRKANLDKIMRSSSYRLAYKDVDFLSTASLRPVRMQLELLKPEMAFLEHRIRSTVVVFGGTRVMEPSEARRDLELARAALADTPDDSRRQRAVQRAERIVANSRYYEMAREFAALVSGACHNDKSCDYVIVTGGGPGLMEAANRGAAETGAMSVGLNIRLPHEQAPNAYITPGLCFQFHYFAMRKFHFLLRAKALVVFPGGFGTLDELFDALTLRQTGRMQKIPIIIFGREYWEKVIDFQFLADEGAIKDEDLDLFRFADSPEQAWEMIQGFHKKHAT